MDSGQAQLTLQLPTPTFPYHTTSNDTKLRSDSSTPRPPPTVNMNGSDIPAKTEVTSAPQGVWSTPTSQGMRPRPATIHEGFSYCMGEGYDGLPAWDSSTLPLQQTPSDTMSSRPISVHQEFYPPTTMGTNNWAPKPCGDDNIDIQGLEADMNIGQAYTADEAIPILDLRYSNSQMEGGESLNLENGMGARRMSGSSFTMSTTGGLSDMTSYEDFSAAMSDAPSFTSDYPPPSNRNSMMSSTQLSPVASPRMTPQSRSELVRTQSRGRASPSPRPGMRSAPYSVESARNKRWSTGSYGTTTNRRPSPFVYHHPHDAYGPRMSSRHSSPTIAHTQVPLNMGNLQTMQQQPPYFMPPNPAFPRHSMLLPSQLPSNAFHDPHHFDNPPPLMSHGLFRMLQSNADPHTLHGHYTDLSDPPDLYASLHEEQIPPPPEDMNPSDPDLVPHEQELRFDGDLYTPRWVRGHGNKREGWCGICKPGRWLVLKNSAFWYDKSFTHGISAATGNPFQEPQETRRMDGNPDVWEGLCSSCNDWIALVSSKKKGTTWFRHAYKCHTHPKIKDAPKRRRESGHTRLAASSMAKPKMEPQTPMTPQMTPGSMSMSMVNTPTVPPMPQLPQQHQHLPQQFQTPQQMHTPQQLQTPQQHQHMPPPLSSPMHHGHIAAPMSSPLQPQEQASMMQPSTPRHHLHPHQPTHAPPPAHPQMHIQVAHGGPPQHPQPRPPTSIINALDELANMI